MFVCNFRTGLLLTVFCFLSQNYIVNSSYFDLQYDLKIPGFDAVLKEDNNIKMDEDNVKIVNEKESNLKYNYPSGIDFPDTISAAFFVNWAIYRSDGYAFTVQNLTSEVIKKLDIIYYGFAFFCPNASMYHPYWTADQDKRLKICQSVNYTNDDDAFKLTWIDPHDQENIQKLQALAQQYNPDLKIVLSIGGWTFPSNFFSQMASSEKSRSILINSIAEWVNENNLDGIDFDWEYPGSAPRVDAVEITTEIFKMVRDDGGKPYDRENFVTFLTELRANPTMKNKVITLCGQAGLMNVENGFDVASLTKVVDFINVMTYDYTVSAVNSSAEANRTAPNQPLYDPGENLIVAHWNINQTLTGYIEMGAPPQQLLVGIALYGHMWSYPGCDVYDKDCWNSFGLPATYPGPNNTRCANVTAFGWAPSAGKYTKQCGFYSIYEIYNAGFMNVAILDNVTMNMISYTDTPGSDDEWTPAGTWITWMGLDGIQATIEFAQSLGIPGGFAFDLSTDMHANGMWTFQYFKKMADTIKNNGQK